MASLRQEQNDKPPQAQEPSRKESGANLRDDKSYVELGDAYDDRGELAEAAAAYKRALGLNPRSDQAYMGLGLVHQECKELTAAVAGGECRRETWREEAESCK